MTPFWWGASALLACRIGYILGVKAMARQLNLMAEVAKQARLRRGGRP